MDGYLSQNNVRPQYKYNLIFYYMLYKDFKKKPYPNKFTLTRGVASLNSSEVPRQHLMAPGGAPVLADQGQVCPEADQLRGVGLHHGGGGQSSPRRYPDLGPLQKAVHRVGHRREGEDAAGEGGSEILTQESRLGGGGCAQEDCQG